MEVGWFFFSSRRRHTRYWRDWSSDVCSSDLVLCGGEALPGALLERFHARLPGVELHNLYGPSEAATAINAPRCVAEPGRAGRSEERRAGKGVDLGGRRIIKKKNLMLLLTGSQ